ncbi:MAG: DUF1624 domain-containing protein, partial [Oscillospiraceae bacterium]|nr:DUF1624 domain-containing protein [Oscillospiraceae bacterium]
MKRIAFLDLARGIAMIYVILYHIMFDIRYIFELPVPELLRPGNAVFEAAHVIFLWVLFSVSGICLTLSRDPVRRGAVLYLAGFGITLVTELFMPSELIVFGVLSCFGACMVIMGLCRRAIAKLPLWTAAVTFLLWFILRHFPQYIDLVFTRIQPELSGYGYLYPIGIIPEG